MNGLKFSAYTCQCLKSFSIFSWKSLTSINGTFPTHEVSQASPLFITPGYRIQNKALLCLRERSSSCPNQRYGSLSAYKDQLGPPDQTLRTLDMEQDTWRELPGILAFLLFEAFLGTVPGTCHFSPWILRVIHQFLDQSGFPLPRGERRRKKERVAAPLLFDLSFDLLLISTLQESSKGNLPPLDANGEQKNKPSQTKTPTHSVSLSGQPAL